MLYLLIGYFFSSCVFSFAVVSESSTVQLSPSLHVKNSPGSKPGITVVCDRVKICGVSRVRYLRKIANSVKVKVSLSNSSSRPSIAEVCFHR